jgi:hypothetical protein
MKDNLEPDILKHHEYPTIEGKFKSIYMLSSILINKMKLKMNDLYTNSNVKNPVVTSQIHKIILDLFIEDYYPLLSRNIKFDIHTMTVIMGGTAFNMNIPIKMNKNLYTQSDDIDIKIYTTDINTQVKNNSKLSNVLSIFKYVMVIICFYIKQIVAEIIEYSRNAFEPLEPYIKRTMKNMGNMGNMGNLYNKTIKLSSMSKNKTKVSEVMQSGRINYVKNKNLIKLKQRRFGILKSFKFKIQFKKENENEKTKDIIDITDMSYNDTYNLLMSKLVDPDIMITTKISYSIKHIKLIIPYEKSRPTITFSDTKIIYPSIYNPYFFSYYFMNIHKNVKNLQNSENITLEQLLKQNINISSIIDTKSCNNNCRYISIKYLQIDIIYMLRFAELIEHEDILKGIIVVPVGSIYKYYKYLIKFIRTYIIKKFFNGTLANNKNFIDSCRKLIRYVENNLNRETKSENEALPINILCKNIISNFHQSFFINQKLFPEYESLREMVNDYNTTVKYINRSCSLFKKLDDDQDDSGKTLDSISIQFGDNKFKDEMSKNKENSIEGGGKKYKNKIILHDNYSYEDIELDDKHYKDSSKNINKNIIKNISKGKDNDKKSLKNKLKSSEDKIIINKIYKMLKNEIQFLGKLSQSIKK